MPEALQIRLAFLHLSVSRVPSPEFLFPLPPAISLEIGHSRIPDPKVRLRVQTHSQTQPATLPTCHHHHHLHSSSQTTSSSAHAAPLSLLAAMADRKALNHYYPPDFDPSKIPRRKQSKDAQQTVRLMAPFSMRCLLCGEYIYKGKKFNARKELVLGEDYYGIKIFRFYIKCTQCSAEITFKTDPKNADYIAEHGASRNFIPTKDDGGGEEKGESGGLLTEEEKLESKLEKMQADPMKQLEERTMDSRREMEILDALQDIRTRNARLERVNAEAVLASLHGGGGGGGVRKAERGAGGGEEGNLEEKERRKAEEEDEELVNKYFGKALDSNGGDSRLKVKRKLENETEAEPDVHTLLAMKGAAVATAPTPASKKKKNGRNALGLVRKKK